MIKPLRFLLAILTATALFTACEDEPDFSSDSRLRLAYSTDSVKFEPLLTEQATSTHVVKVWNNSGEDLKINNIELRSASNSFQMIADGRSGTSINNLEIRKGDSLYIFVRANLKKHTDNQPVMINDSIVFSYNGNKDRIILNAVGRNAKVLRHYTIESDTTWTKEQPFLVFDSLKVAEGAKLTIKAGTEIYFHRNSKFIVEGSLDIQGNASDMVLFSGDRLDDIGSNIPYTNIYGQWEGISIKPTSTNNIMEGLLMRGATYGIVIDSAEIVDNQYRIIFANSEIRTSKYGNLYVNNARIKAYNTIFANGGTYNVYLMGGDYLFNHCTISEFSTSSLRNRASLQLNGNENCPISNALFNNCIINGSHENEVSIEDADWCKYSINNSLVKTTNSDTTDYYTNCVLNKEAGFNFRTKIYFYDFHIDSTSNARGIGDATLIEQFPECGTDLDGNVRPTEGKTDAGAYIYDEIQATKKD